MKEKKDIFKEFEEEYGISLILDSTPTPQQQAPENLFSKLHRFKNRKILCDMDITEYKKYKMLEKIIKVAIITFTIMSIFLLCSNISIKKGVTKCNLVSSVGATEPAFLGYKFTDELIAEIKTGNIDLYDMYIVEDDVDNGIGNVRIENKYGFPVKEVRISDANYIEYSDEYIHKMFSEEYIKSHKGKWGYWEYIIDIDKQ